MSVVIVGGNECMIRQYKNLCRTYQCKAKVYPQMMRRMENIGSPDLKEQMIRHCSPTLAGMKTGSMFLSFYSDINEMRAAVRHWNKRLTRKGLRVLPLRFWNNRALIYVYRPERLLCDLQNETACQLLCKCGYGTEHPERCITHLMRRINEQSEFPHEIGLFLGYPPEDVCGFIKNKAKGKSVERLTVSDDDSRRV